MLYRDKAAISTFPTRNFSFRRVNNVIADWAFEKPMQLPLIFLIISIRCRSLLRFVFYNKLLR